MNARYLFVTGALLLSCGPSGDAPSPTSEVPPPSEATANDETQANDEGDEASAADETEGDEASAADEPQGEATPDESEDEEPLQVTAAVRIVVPPGHLRLGCGRHIAKLPDGAQVETACGTHGTSFLPSGAGWVGGRGVAEVTLGECRITLDLREALIDTSEESPAEFVVGTPVATPARRRQTTRDISGSVVLGSEHGSELVVQANTYDAECTAALNEVIESVQQSLMGLPLRTHSVAEIPLTTSGETLLVQVPVQNVLVWTGHASDQYENSYQLRSINGAERAGFFGHRGPTRAQAESPNVEANVFGAPARFKWENDMLMTVEDEERMRHVAEFRTPDDQGTLVITLPERTRLGVRVIGTIAWGHGAIPELP